MSDQEQTGSVLTGSSDASTTDAQAPADWRAGLPEEVRNDPSLSDIKDVGSMAKSYINGQKLIGKNRIALPAEGATDEEISMFHSQLGRPEKADGYQFGDRPSLPEGMQYDEAFETQFKDLSYKAGLTPNQAKAIYDGYHDYIGKKTELAGESTSQQSAEWVNSLKKEFGKAYDERVDLAQRAVDSYGDGPLKQWLTDSGNGNNPMFVKLFAKIGNKWYTFSSDEQTLDVLEDNISASNQDKYTITNFTEDRTYNANSTSTAELADILGTLIRDLKRLGFLKSDIS